MKNNLNDLAALDDRALKELVTDITKVLGADPKKAAPLTEDPARLRSILSGMSSSDVEKLINKAGKEKSKEIYDTIQRRRGNG